MAAKPFAGGVIPRLGGHITKVKRGWKWKIRFCGVWVTCPKYYKSESEARIGIWQWASDMAKEFDVARYQGGK